jgi:predicted oxidoreductase
LKKVMIANCDLDASEISLGCMRIWELANTDIARLIHTALDEGINFLTMRIFMAVANRKRNFPRPLI